MGPYQAGRYTIAADDRKNGAYAAADVLLEGTDLEVPLVLVPGASLRGRIAFASGAPPAGLTPRMIRGSLRFPDAPGSWPRSELFVADDWTFEIKGLGGTLRLEPTVLRPDVVVSAILVGDRVSLDGSLDFSRGDVTDVRVVLSQRLTAVSGQVVTERELPASDATVLIFPEETARWGLERHVATVRTGSNGTFNHRGLPPGRYRAIAVDYVENGSELDPEFLDRLKADATPVMLVEDETRVVELSISD